jgi:hypothetical protein
MDYSIYVQPKLPAPNERSRAWEVQRGPYLLDTVFFTPDCDAEYVRKSLIEHDNYPSDIMVSLRRG